MSFNILKTRNGRLKYKIQYELKQEEPNIDIILQHIEQYEKDNLETIDKLKRKRVLDTKRINGGLRQAINVHGPITKVLIDFDLAYSSPKALILLDPTIIISAGKLGSSQASINFCIFDPRPEINIATLIFFFIIKINYSKIRTLNCHHLNRYFYQLLFRDEASFLKHFLTH